MKLELAALQHKHLPDINISLLNQAKVAFLDITY